MIFTIGLSEWYDTWIVEQGTDFKKKGLDGDYPGGSAFLCFGKALKARPKEYKIYQLDTDISNLYLIGEQFHIKESCRIVELIL